jgi:hypothetical protein
VFDLNQVFDESGLKTIMPHLRSAPVPGRSIAQAAKHVKQLRTDLYTSIAVAEDGHTPHFDYTR